jgi:hypothetical protein
MQKSGVGFHLVISPNALILPISLVFLSGNRAL